MALLIFIAGMTAFLYTFFLDLGIALLYLLLLKDRVYRRKFIVLLTLCNGGLFLFLAPHQLITSGIAGLVAIIAAVISSAIGMATAMVVAQILRSQVPRMLCFLRIAASTRRVRRHLHHRTRGMFEQHRPPISESVEMTEVDKFARINNLLSNLPPEERLAYLGQIEALVTHIHKRDLYIWKKSGEFDWDLPLHPDYDGKTSTKLWDDLCAEWEQLTPRLHRGLQTIEDSLQNRLRHPTSQPDFEEQQLRKAIKEQEVVTVPYRR